MQSPILSKARLRRIAALDILEEMRANVNSVDRIHREYRNSEQFQTSAKVLLFRRPDKKPRSATNAFAA